jgi:hypothetical protein
MFFFFCEATPQTIRPSLTKDNQATGCECIDVASPPQVTEVMEAKSVSLDACKHLVTQVNCKMLKIAKITRHCDPLGQSHSTFQTEPTAACEKSNLGAEGGANASVGTPGAKATWLPSCPFWKPGRTSLGSGAQSNVLQRHRGPMPNSPGGGPAFPVFGHALTMANGVQLAQVLMLFQA